MTVYIGLYDSNVLVKDVNEPSDTSQEANPWWKINAMKFRYIRFPFFSISASGFVAEEKVSPTAFSDSFIMPASSLQNEQLILIQQLFADGKLKAAERLVNEMIDELSGDPVFERYKKLFSPPTYKNKVPFSVEGIRKNQEWLRQNGMRYKGKWIGLDRGELLFAVDKLQDAQAEQRSIEGIFITRI